MPSRSFPEGEVFGRTLRRLRESAETSQQQLAAKAGLTTNYLSDLERGVKVASLTTVLKLAFALDVPPADLLADFTPATIKRVLR